QYPSFKGQSAKSAPAHPSTPSVSAPAPSTAQQQPSAEAEQPSDQGDLPAPKLADGALQDLDRFIGKSGSGNSGSGNGSVDQEGSVPTGDTGSGVFFDTQGYDLGPWGNHVVAIVRRNWIVPVAAELGVKGIVAISFKVDRSGKIIEPKIISS